MTLQHTTKSVLVVSFIRPMVLTKLNTTNLSTINLETYFITMWQPQNFCQQSLMTSKNTRRKSGTNYHSKSYLLESEPTTQERTKTMPLRTPTSLTYCNTAYLTPIDFTLKNSSTARTKPIYHWSSKTNYQKSPCFLHISCPIMATRIFQPCLQQVVAMNDKKKIAFIYYMHTELFSWACWEQCTKKWLHDIFSVFSMGRIVTSGQACSQSGIP